MRNSTAYDVTEMRIQRDKTEKWYRKLSTKQYERPNYHESHNCQHSCAKYSWCISSGNASM